MNTSPGLTKTLAKAVTVLIALAGLAWIGIRAGPAAMAGSSLSGAPSPSVLVSAPVLPGLPTGSAVLLSASVASAALSPPEGEKAPSPGRTSDGKIALNQASEADLVSLSGIGPKRAQAILALRSRLGRFRTAQELLRVKGIGKKTLERLRPQLVIDAASTPSP